MENEKSLFEKYEEIKKDYDFLPEFELLAEDFDIERVQEKESSFLLREIRRAMAEKIYSYIHLLENFLSANSNSLFIFSLLKNASEEDKKQIKKIYEELLPFQTKVILLDTNYSERNEAKFISELFNKWQDLKKKIEKLFKRLSSKEKTSQTNNTSYYLN